MYYALIQWDWRAIGQSLVQKHASRGYSYFEHPSTGVHCNAPEGWRDSTGGQQGTSKNKQSTELNERMPVAAYHPPVTKELH